MSVGRPRVYDLKTPLQRRRAATKYLRNKRIERGECPSCGAEPVPGRQSCQKHLEMSRQRAATSRDRKRGSGCAIE